MHASARSFCAPCARIVCASVWPRLRHSWLARQVQADKVNNWKRGHDARWRHQQSVVMSAAHVFAMAGSRGGARLQLASRYQYIPTYFTTVSILQGTLQLLNPMALSRCLRHCCETRLINPTTARASTGEGQLACGHAARAHCRISRGETWTTRCLSRSVPPHSIDRSVY